MGKRHTSWHSPFPKNFHKGVAYYVTEPQTDLYRNFKQLIGAKLVLRLRQLYPMFDQNTRMWLILFQLTDFDRELIGYRIGIGGVIYNLEYLAKVNRWGYERKRKVPDEDSRKRMRIRGHERVKNAVMRLERLMNELQRVQASVT